VFKLNTYVSCFVSFFPAGHGACGPSSEPSHFAAESDSGAEAATAGRHLEQRQLLAGHLSLHSHQGWLVNNF